MNKMINKSNKKFKTYIALLLIMTVCSLLMLAGCTPKEPDSTEPASTVATDTSTAAETTAAATTAETVSTDILVLPEYIPVKAYDENGAEIGLNMVYGTGYSEYGGSLCFLEDGTFTTYIGVFGNINNESGTYKFISDTEIEMTYNNDSTEIATVTATDDNGNITELKMPHRGFDVLFCQK